MNPMQSISSPLVVISWPSFGPYHVARIQATANYLANQGWRLAALEIFASKQDDSLWERAEGTGRFECHTLFPALPAGKISKRNLLRRMWSYLDEHQPRAVAINGYSSWDAWFLLAWCRTRGAFPILMSDSKWDDAPRKILFEKAKKRLVGLYGAALCAGTAQRAYLESLGMSPNKIFDGYDVVDNQFFSEQSDLVRRSPDSFRRLPGLEDPRPYFLASARFIPRKNFLTLLRAYAFYREECRSAGREAWRLVLLGDGPQRAAIAQEIQTLNLQNDVVLAGVHAFRHLPVYYGLASAFIHPPLQDQWGLVVNEAMASGLAVLVSRGAGCAADLVEDGVEGFLFDPQDAACLSRMMNRISSGQVDLQKMGAAARQKISGWGVERFAQHFHRALCVGWGG
jgi:glycosyltransferase involved in cell wall biosynthesis